MSTVDVTELKERVEREQRIEELKDGVIDQVKEFLEEGVRKYGRDRDLATSDDPGDNQFQDLIRKAGTTTSVKELTSFIRYQIGRDKNHRNWNRGNLGEDLIAQIDAVSRKADKNALPQMELVSLFLGYLHRQVKYIRRARGQSAGQQKGGQAS